MSDSKKAIMIKLEVSLYEAGAMLDGLRSVAASTLGTVEEPHITGLAIYILDCIRKADSESYKVIMDALMPKGEALEQAKEMLRSKGIDVDKLMSDLPSKTSIEVETVTEGYAKKKVSGGSN